MTNVGDFERATGVVEMVRQCLEKGCGKMFRAPNQHATTCPHCQSDKTQSIRESGGLAVGGHGPGRMVT